MIARSLVLIAGLGLLSAYSVPAHASTIPGTPPQTPVAPSASVPANPAPDSGTNVSAVTPGAPGREPRPSDVYSQLVSITAGGFTPQSAVITNGSYTFDYGSGTTTSFLAEAGWAIRLFDAWPGSFFISENIAYSRFSGNPVAGVTDTTLNVNLVGLDSRLNYSIERFPIKWLIPFGEGGYQETFYSQTGNSDLDSVQGSTGNFVAGAGLRVWVNRGASLNTDLTGTYSTIPVFLVFKWNRIYPNGKSLDLADSLLMGGVSVGL